LPASTSDGDANAEDEPEISDRGDLSIDLNPNLSSASSQPEPNIDSNFGFNNLDTSDFDNFDLATDDDDLNTVDTETPAPDSYSEPELVNVAEWSQIGTESIDSSLDATLDSTFDSLTPPPVRLDLSQENLDSLIDNFYNRSLSTNQFDRAEDVSNFSGSGDRGSPTAPDFETPATLETPHSGNVSEGSDRDDDDSFGDFIQDLQGSSIDSTADDHSDSSNTSEPTISPEMDTEIAEPPILAIQASPQDFDPDAETQIAGFAGAIAADDHSNPSFNNNFNDFDDFSNAQIDEMLERIDQPESVAETGAESDEESDDLIAWLESSADNLQQTVSPSTFPEFPESLDSLSIDAAVTNRSEPDAPEAQSDRGSVTETSTENLEDLLDQEPELLAWLEQQDQPESTASTNLSGSEAKFSQDFGSKFGIVESEPKPLDPSEPDDRQDSLAADRSFGADPGKANDDPTASRDQDFMSWLNSGDSGDRFDPEQMLTSEPIEAANNIINIVDGADPEADAELDNARLAYLEADDDVDRSDESLILLLEEDRPDPETSLAEDELLLADLDQDLESLDIGTGVNPIVAANLDLAIRNTPFPGKGIAKGESSAEATPDPDSLDSPDSNQALPGAANYANYPEQVTSAADDPPITFSDRQDVGLDSDFDFQDLFADSAFAADTNQDDQNYSDSSLFPGSDRTGGDLDPDTSSSSEDLFAEIPAIIDDAAVLFEKNLDQQQSNNQAGENISATDRNDWLGFDLDSSLDSGIDTGFDTGFGDDTGNDTTGSEEIPRIVDDSGALFGFSNSSNAIDQDNPVNEAFGEVTASSFPDYQAELNSLQISGNIDESDNIDQTDDRDLTIDELLGLNDLDAEIPLPKFDNSDSSSHIDQSQGIDQVLGQAESLLPELPDLEAQLERDLRLEWQRSVQEQSDLPGFPNGITAAAPPEEEDDQFDLLTNPVSSHVSSDPSDAAHDLGRELDELFKDIDPDLDHEIDVNDVDRELDTILQGIDIDTDMDTVLEGLPDIDDDQDAATILNALTADFLTGQDTEIESSLSPGLTAASDYNADSTRDFYETLEDAEEVADIAEVEELEDELLNQFADDQDNQAIQVTNQTDQIDNLTNPADQAFNEAESYLNAELDALAESEDEELEDEPDFLSEAEMKLTELADREAEDYTWQGFSPADAEAAQPDQDPAWNAAIFNLPDFQIDQDVNSTDLRFNPPDADDQTFDRPDSFLDVEAVEVEPETVESHLNLILQPIGNPPPPGSNHSASDTWFLGIDFGSTHLSASLVNANTGSIYPLSFGDLNDAVTTIPSVGMFTTEQTGQAEQEILTRSRQRLPSV
jgi:hypothetical protein